MAGARGNGFNGTRRILILSPSREQGLEGLFARASFFTGILTVTETRKIPLTLCGLWTQRELTAAPQTRCFSIG
jgi:hypothetical protein